MESGNQHGKAEGAGGPVNYKQCAERGVGRRIIAKMLEGTETEGSIKQALETLPMTERRRYEGMFRIMGLENSEDWMNPVQHTEQVIKQGRAFFDDWLERFPAWVDFVQALSQATLHEFGARRETAIKLVTEWLGGAAEAPHNYANIVKYGVGATILHRFTGIPESTIKAALLSGEQPLIVPGIVVRGFRRWDEPPYGR